MNFIFIEGPLFVNQRFISVFFYFFFMHRKAHTIRKKQFKDNFAQKSLLLTPTQSIY